MGGSQKGYVTTEDFYRVFDRTMPKGFDRDIALEAFRELDSDKDGKMSFKDFSDCLRF